MNNTVIFVKVEPREPPSLELYPAAVQTVTLGESAVFQVTNHSPAPGHVTSCSPLIGAQCRYTRGIPAPAISWTRADGRPLPGNVQTLSGGVIR